MNNRKQEMIKALLEVMKREFLLGKGARHSEPSKHHAKIFYNTRIAPMMQREFPKHRFVPLLNSLCEGNITLAEAVERGRRIWGDKPEMLEHPIYPTVKVVDTEKCQHKGNIGWLDADNKIGPPTCFDCGADVERRSDKERRRGKERKVNIPHRDKQPAPTYEEYISENTSAAARPDRRTQPDRREAVKE